MLRLLAVLLLSVTFAMGSACDDVVNQRRSITYGGVDFHPPPDLSSDMDLVGDTRRDNVDVANDHGPDVPFDFGPDMLPPGCVESESEIFAESFSFTNYMAPGVDRVLYSADEFREALGVDPPPGIDFTQYAVGAHFGTSIYGDSARLEATLKCDENGESYALPKLISVTAGSTCNRPAADPLTMMLFLVPRTENFDFLAAGGNEFEEVICLSTSPAEGAPCTRRTYCQPGLLCAGFTQGDEGVCVPATNEVVVDNRDSVAIPDGDPAGVTSINLVEEDHPGVVADIFFTANIQHADMHRLSLQLESPDGTRVDVQHDNRIPGGHTPLHGFEGVPAAGQWTLHVVDDIIGNKGELDRWELVIITQ